jgi:hypothetical protein
MRLNPDNGSQGGSRRTLYVFFVVRRLNREILHVAVKLSNRRVYSAADHRMLRVGSMGAMISNSRRGEPLWRDIRTPLAAPCH